MKLPEAVPGVRDYRNLQLVYLSTCLLVYLSTCLLAYLSTCLPVYLPTCLLVYLSTCLLVYPFVAPDVNPSINCRWMTATKMTAGISISTAMAVMPRQSATN